MKRKNNNIETAEIFNSLVKIYAAGNVSKFASITKKDRSYINRMRAGKHSVSFENLIKIFRSLENDHTSNSFQVVQNVVLKIRDFQS